MKKDVPPNKGGRPTKEIDPEMIEKLASIGCTGDEIAAVIDCYRDMLYARFSDSLKKGQNKARATLRSLQWNAAASGNAAIQI